jgi:hypothetical protein
MSGSLRKLYQLKKEALTKARAVLEAICSELYAWQSNLRHLSFEHICQRARTSPVGEGIYRKCDFAGGSGVRSVIRNVAA